MRRHAAIAPGVEQQRFFLGPEVFLHLPQKNDVIAAVELPRVPANQLGRDALQARHTGLPLLQLNPCKPVGNLRSKLPGQAVLPGRQKY